MIVLTDFDLGPELVLDSAALFSCCGADGADNGLALRLDLDDLEFDLLAHELRKISILGKCGLRGGDEYACAHNGSNDAALYSLGHIGFKSFVVLLRLCDLVPVLVKVSALLGQHSTSVHIAHANDEGVYSVADLVHLTQLYRSIVCSLIGGQYTGDFGAEIKLHFLIADGDNCTGNGVSCI